MAHIKNESLPIKIIFKCGHSIISKAFKYSVYDPTGTMFECAKNGGSIRQNKVCSMCREDARWKS